MMYTDGMFGGLMMWGMGLLGILVLVFLVTGIAAFIKYLRRCEVDPMSGTT